MDTCSKGKVVIEREMAITHAEFYRLIGRTISDPSVLKMDKKAAVVSFPFAHGAITIHLNHQSSRKMGSLSLPLTVIRFEFHDLLKSDIGQYLQKFDITFQRGGG